MAIATVIATVIAAMIAAVIGMKIVAVVPSMTTNNSDVSDNQLRGNVPTLNVHMALYVLSSARARSFHVKTLHAGWWTTTY